MSNRGRKPDNTPNLIRDRRKAALKTVLLETGYDGKQYAFAEDVLRCSKEHFSAVVNGRKNLTYEAAQIINAKFPEYSIDFLLGNTLNKSGFSQDEKRSINSAVKARYRNLEAAENLIFQHGYQTKDSESGEIIISDTNGAEISMKPKEYMLLLNTINDLVEGYLLTQFQLHEGNSRPYWR